MDSPLDIVSFDGLVCECHACAPALTGMVCAVCRTAQGARVTTRGQMRRKAYAGNAGFSKTIWMSSVLLVRKPASQAAK